MPQLCAPVACMAAMHQARVLIAGILVSTRRNVKRRAVAGRPFANSMEYLGASTKIPDLLLHLHHQGHQGRHLHHRHRHHHLARLARCRDVKPSMKTSALETTLSPPTHSRIIAGTRRSAALLTGSRAFKITLTWWVQPLCNTRLIASQRPSP